MRLGKVGNAYDFAPLPDGGYLFLWMDDARELLARTDSAGRITRSFLPIADYVPPGLRNREAWRRAIAPIMRVHGDTALVTLAPADSLWRVDLATGSATAFPIRPPDDPAPRDPEGSIGDTAVYRRWNESYTRVSGVVRVPGRTLVAFTRPVGDTIATTMVERADDGSLIALRNAPVMFVNDGGLPARLVAGETTAAIVRWRRRP